MAKKFYVVWRGRETGVFTDWPTCQSHIDHFPGAKYKSFKTRAEADAAFKSGTSGPSQSRSKVGSPGKPKTSRGSLDTAQVDKVDAQYKLFTDGACNPNPGQAASGMAVYLNGELVELWTGLYVAQGTNNIAELNALHRAMDRAKTLKEKSTVAIFCDSKYSIQCVTQWAKGWAAKNWQRKEGEPIKNLDLIKPMFALHQTLDGSVPIHHVNGHVGIEGNELADRMSMLGIEQKTIDFDQYNGSLDVETILAMRSG